LALVKDGPSIFEQIALAAGRSADTSVHFEYSTSAPGVKGNPSHTDAMVISPHSAVAVEAKWTEPRYETVVGRLRTSVRNFVRRSHGKGDAAEYLGAQQKVVNAWLELLRPCSTRPLNYDIAGEVVYQMVHRAASACATGRPPTLVYLHFHSASTIGGATADEYKADLEDLYKLLGNPLNLSVYFAELGMEPTETFRPISSLRKGSEDTDRRVRAAISSTRLFNFADAKIDRIG
jgi:hypothetical protein